MSLKLENVKKSYPEFEMELSFYARKGQILTLLGPSGCGKTTTLLLIAGFLNPDTGKIYINGHNVKELPPHRRKTGIVFQDYSLFPHMNVFNNIAFGLRMQKWPREKIKNRVNELLELIRLSGYQKRNVSHLSGGEQQRVALARALAPHPSLLLLDEPLSALDAKLRKELRGEIRRIQQQLNITTIYVTHDQEEALSLSDTVAVMKDGKIEQVGTPYEIYTRPQTHFVADFIGVRNRITGTVLNISKNRLEVKTKEGLFEVSLPEDTNVLNDIIPRISLSLLFRPEQCFLLNQEYVPGEHLNYGKKTLKNNYTSKNILSGRVISCEYLGESTVIEFDTGQGKYSARLQGLARCRTGETVAVHIPPHQIWVMKEGG